MRFILVTSEQLRGGRVVLRPDQAHHLVDVLRRRPGDRVRAVVPGTDSLDTRLVLEPPAGRRGPESAFLEIVATEPLPPPPGPPVSLAVGLLKDDKLEEVARRATELGVRRILLVKTSRSVVRPKSGKTRLGRLAEIVRGSCEQSGNPHPPTIAAFDSVDEWIMREPPEGALVVAVASGGQPLAEVPLDARGGTVLVGPEGDLTPEETDRAVAAGGRAVTLSGHVLRSETACVVLVSLLLSRLGRL